MENAAFHDVVFDVRGFLACISTILACAAGLLLRVCVHTGRVGFSQTPSDFGLICRLCCLQGGDGLRGGGLLSVQNLHMRVQGCWFLRFGTVGLSVLNGHEFYVDDTWYH